MIDRTFIDAARDEPVRVRLERVAGEGERYRVAIDGREIECDVVRRGESAWLHFDDGRIVPFRSSEADDHVSVWADGERVELDIEQQTARRTGGADAALASDRLVAPMPGTVLKVLVKEGDSFSANEPLVVMESMKMEMSLSVARDGVVASVSCQEGDLVEMDTVLVQLEAGE